MGGGSSKKQKIGNKYRYGVALVVCRQMDAVLALVMSDKTAWSGRKGQGRLSIQKPDLFGGDEREGGFEGDIDVQLGGLDQGVNDYLSSAKGGLTSAMRGCASLILRRPWISSNTARLPSIKILVTNISGIHRGWFPEKSVVNSDLNSDGNDFYIVYSKYLIQSSGEFSAQIEGIAAFVRSLKGGTNSLRIIAKQGLYGSIDIEAIDCSSDEDYEAIAVQIETDERSFVNLYVNPLTISDAPNFFETGSSGALLTFKNTLLGISESSADGDRTRHFIYITANTPAQSDVNSAKAILNGIDDLNVSCIAVSDDGDTSAQTRISSMDNTTVDGTPLVDSAAGVLASMQNIVTGWADMNPAHIIRCLWTDPMRGGTVDDSEIGDSFEVAADLFLSEGMGFSPKFRGLDQADADRGDIERHVDAISFRSNRTGKIELVPIRNDYDVGDLITLDSSIVTDWSGLSRPRKSEIPNQLTVTYTRRDGEAGSVTRTNTAGVRRQGRVIKAEQIAYPSCTTEALAIRLCMRDLRFATTDVLSGTLPLTYLPPEIEPGSVVIINEPLLSYDNILMRVSEVRIGKHDDSTAWVTLTEENFATTQDVVSSEVDAGSIRPAKQVKYRLVTEASYYQGVFSMGQTTLDDELEAEPDLGRMLVTGAKADDNQLEATLAVGSAEDWADQGLVDFEPYGELLGALSASASENTFLVSDNSSLIEVNEGDLARIDDEIIRIDNLVDQGDGTVLVTCGRGCLDGPPSFHAAGSAFVVSSIVEALSSDFVSGQSIGVKMLSRTGSDVLSLSDAETETLVFASRAIRPYPVGRLRIDDTYTPNTQGFTNISATWAHRDRTIQTTPYVDDYDAGNIGPEADVVYTARVNFIGFHADVYAVSDVYAVGDVYTDFETVSSGAVTLSADQVTAIDFDVPLADVYSVDDVYAVDDVYENDLTLRIWGLDFCVTVTRDGYDNMLSSSIGVPVIMPPLNFNGSI